MIIITFKPLTQLDKYRIEINTQLQEENNLKLTNIKVFDQNDIIITGHIICQSKNLYKEVVVGAYMIKDNKVIQTSAYALKTNATGNYFKLTFNNEVYDNIYIYSDLIEKSFEKEDNEGYYDESEEDEDSISVSFSVDEDSADNETRSILKKLEKNIELGSSMKDMGLSIDNVFLESISDSLWISCDLYSENEVNEDFDFYCELLDKTDRIRGSNYEFIDSDKFIKFRSCNWNYEHRNMKKLHKIRFFVKKIE
ncbi:MAG: hypothetical protein IJJ47_01020 [Methanosphaera sp.]|nr:hypothetical protein [Methanosphaera sp.]